MRHSKKYKLVICTTVPDTILYILNGQPRFLNQYFDVVIITNKSVKNRSLTDYEGVIIYELKFKRNINLLKDLKSLIQMIFLLLRIRPDIVHSYTPKAGLITMLSAWIVMVPIRIHTFTGLVFPHQKGLKKKLLIFIDRLICFCSTKIIPEGLGVKSDLISYSITKKNLEIIGNGNISGVNTAFFSSTAINYEFALESLGIKADYLFNKFVYCFVGRLNVDKGLSELYDAFIDLPENTILLIAGDLDNEGSPISADLYNKLISNKRIIYLGFINDVRLVLKLSNVLVLPSYREGFPNVLLQSLSMRVPAIATNISGCNEIIFNNLNGWLVEPKNHKALADKMLFTFTVSKKCFEKIKDYSRLSIIERYEQSYYREELLTMYNNLINHRKIVG
jgi:glycosyltransferase involved in cell wall biosynthesis